MFRKQFSIPRCILYTIPSTEIYFVDNSVYEYTYSVYTPVCKQIFCIHFRIRKYMPSALPYMELCSVYKHVFRIQIRLRTYIPYATPYTQIYSRHAAAKYKHATHIISQAGDRLRPPPPHIKISHLQT